MASESEPGDSPAKPFARRWTIATIVYTGGVAIVLFLESRGYWEWVTLPRRSLYAMLAPVFFSLGAQGLYTGKMSIRNFTFYRRKNPFGYWVEVVVLLSIGTVFLLGGLGVTWSWPMRNL